MMQFAIPALAGLVVSSFSVLLLGCAQPQAETQLRDASAAAASSQEVAAADPVAAESPVMHIYKTPTCGCCADWVTHVETAGFKTEVQDLVNLAPVKEQAGLPSQLQSCHTALVGGYVIEGHVPADVIRRLLSEKPDVAGIAVPGMPMGSPGMEGPWKESYDVIAFRRDGSQYVYESR